MKIRIAGERDIGDIISIYAPYVKETAITFEYEVPTQMEFLCRMQEIQSTYPFLVCEEEGCVIGYAYAHRQMERAAYQWNTELSIYVDRAYQGRGGGRALYTALMTLLNLQHVQTVYALIALPNPGSVALHEHMGFRRVGLHSMTGYKLGKWHDVVWYQKVLGDRQSPPPDVLPIHQLEPEKIEKVLAGIATR